jgi:hypothetical protein
VEPDEMSDPVRSPARPSYSWPSPAEVARRVEEAKADGSFGRIRRKARRHVVTCGGCAVRDELDAHDRHDAVMASRDLGWRQRHIPGVQRGRHFCTGCQWDMDMYARFAIAVGKDPEDGYGRWVVGNPRRLPFDYIPPAGAQD